jgi:hypothetical protein
VIAGTALTLVALAIPPTASARPAPALPDPYELGPPTRPLAVAAQTAPQQQPPPTAPGSFSAALAGLLAAGSITRATEQADLASLVAARHSLAKLHGTRHDELAAVIDNLTRIATAGMLTPSRLPALVLTLERNRQYWTTGPLLAFEQRLTFPGSLLVWEYYPGQGIEIQWLASFGKANGYFLSGPTHNAQLGEILDELVGLAVARAGGIAWEYDFNFDGGAPPWVSSISQGTAIQVLSRAAIRLGRPDYFNDARQALPIFATPPPLGVRLTTPSGAWYLIYSFAPHQLVLNAFIQSLVGLYDFATLANDPTGRALFAAGDAEARVDVPHYDTGAWSLYDQAAESDLGYHELLGGFLGNLCRRTQDPAPTIASTLARGDARAAPRSARLVGIGPVTGGSPAPAGGTPPGATPVPAPPPSPAPIPAPTPAPPPAPPAANVYCTTAADFTAYLHQPPKLALTMAGTSRARRSAPLRLTLSKISNIVVVAVHGGRATSSIHEQLGHGTRLLAWTPPTAGRYTITVSATDLAGNSARTSLAVSVASAPSHAKRR